MWHWEHRQKAPGSDGAARGLPATPSWSIPAGSGCKPSPEGQPLLPRPSLSSCYEAEAFGLALATGELTQADCKG